MPLPIVVRVGSQLPLDFHLRTDTDGDGKEDAPLQLIGTLELRLRRADGTAKVFLTTDSPQRLFIMDAAAGHVQLRPTTTTWETADRHYSGIFWLTDYLGKKIPYPIEENFLIRVIE